LKNINCRKFRYWKIGCHWCQPLNKVACRSKVAVNRRYQFACELHVSFMLSWVAWKFHVIKKFPFKTQRRVNWKSLTCIHFWEYRLEIWCSESKTKKYIDVRSLQDPRVRIRGFLQKFLEYIDGFQEEKSKHPQPAVRKSTDSHGKTVHIVAKLWGKFVKIKNLKLRSATWLKVCIHVCVRVSTLNKSRTCMS